MLCEWLHVKMSELQERFSPSMEAHHHQKRSQRVLCTDEPAWLEIRVFPKFVDANVQAFQFGLAQR